MAIKRLHYFDHQFLVEKDFTDEQAYHLGMRRRLNQVLYTSGIADGLLVVRKNASTITVQKGTAIDAQGQEIVLETDADRDLSNRTTFPAGSTITVGVLYQEQQTDPTTATGATGNTRITEQAVIEVTAGTPSPTAVPLARFQLAAGTGDVPAGPLDGGVRKAVAPKAGLGIASISGVNNPGGDVALVAGTGITIVPDVPGHRLTINGTAQGLVSVDGVSAPGGNIDLQAGRAIQITPDNTVNKRITFASTGLQSVNGVTDTANGNVDLLALPASSITITPEAANRRVLISENHSARTDNPHATTAAQVGALLATDFFFGRRTVAVAQFTLVDANGATRSIGLTFQPRYVLAFGSIQTTLGGRNYGGGTFGFADLVNPAAIQQFCTGFGVTKISNTDWLVRPVDNFGVGSNIAYGTFFNSEVAPPQAEVLTVTVTAVTATSMTVTFGRTVNAGANPIGLPNGFNINLRLFIFG